MTTATKPRRAPLAPVPRIHALNGRTLAEVRPCRGETIARFHARASMVGDYAGLPTIVAEWIGEEQRPIPKAEWHRRIGARTRLVLYSKPLGPSGGATGGGGSAGVAGIVGLVALMAVAGPAAGAIASAAFAGAGSSIIQAILVGGGSLLLSHFLNAKRGANSTAAQYSVDLKSNQARSQQPIPRQYGEVKFFPDAAAPPWSDFTGTNQIFHALYSLGLGVFDVHEIGIGQTAIWTAEGGLRAAYADSVKLQFIGPNEDCTLFPVDVFVSTEVSGQTLPDPYGTTYADGTIEHDPDNGTNGVQTLGPFVANPAGTQTNRIAIDLIAPSGMYYTNSRNNTKPVSVDVRLEVQLIDDQGHVLGPWTKVIETPIIRESKQPVRLTLTADVVFGRYQVRLSRLNPMSQDGGVDTMTWVGLRTYLTGPNAVPYASRLAVQMVADKQLSAASSQQLYVIATAHVPVWNGSGMVLAASRNPVWAALDVWSNADYGGGLGYDKVDLPTLIALAADADARGDTFNYRFTAQTTVFEAIETCLAPMLTKPVFLWDQFSMVRDQPRALPRLMVTDHEIRRGTLDLNYTLKDAQTSDGTILEYLDEDTWQQAEVTSRPLGEEPEHPSRLQMPGCTNRRQATVVARYFEATNNYRRKGTSFEIEAEGRLLRRGDLVIVQSEMPLSWGQASRVLTFDQGSRTILVESPLDWSAGGNLFYVRIRQRDGKPYGAVLCGRGADDATIVLNAQDLARVTQVQGSWLDAVARDDTQLPASIEFSPGQPAGFNGLVDAISQGSAENTFKIELVNDAPEVYLIDGQAIEPLPTPSSLVLPAAPTNQLSHVVAYLAQEGTSITLHAQWDADPGSVRYQAQLSYDQGASWGVNAATDFPFLTITGLSPNDCRLRIRGVNDKNLVGGWSNIDLVSPELNLNPASLGFAIGFNDVLPSLYANSEMAPVTALEDLIAVSMDSLVGAATQQTILEQSIAQAHARVEELTYAQALTGQALAGKVLTITAAVNDNTASIKDQVQALATLDKATASHFETLTAKVDGNAAEADRKIQVVADKASTTATDLTTLSTNFGSYSATVNSTLQTQSQTNGSVALQLTSLTATANGAAASVQDEKQARINGDNVVANSVTNLSTTVDGHTGQLSVLGTSVNGVLVQYGVVGTIDGQTGGFIFQGVRRIDGSVSFTTYFRGDLIVDGTIQAKGIAAGAITAFAAVNGPLTTPVNGENGGGSSPLSVSITLDQAAKVLIDFRAQCFNEGSTGITFVAGVLSADGTVYFNDAIFRFAGGTLTIMASCETIVSLPAGTHTITAAASATSSADKGGVTNGYLTVIGFKR